MSLLSQNRLRSLSTTNVQGDFVQQGDRARSAHNLSDAVIAYRMAIDLRAEPRILARLGLVANQFYLFVSPGKHELRAKLAGFQDVVVMIDAPKDETMRVSLNLMPIPPPDPPSPHLAPITNEKRNDAPTTNPKPSYLVKPSPWSVGAGVVALSGAISYLPATGLMAGVERRFGEWFSVRLDARAASSPQYVATPPLRGFTYAGLLGACATRTKYFGCVRRRQLPEHDQETPRNRHVRP